MSALLKSALIALVALCPLVGGASAMATTWGNSGASAFTATAGVFEIDNPVAGSLVCTGPTNIMTGTFGAGTTAAVWTNAFTGTLTFSSCRLNGSNVAFSCTYGFTATTHTPTSDPSPGLGGAPTGGFVDLAAANGHSCSATAVVQVCTFTGSIGTTYTNPTPATGTPTRPATTALAAGRLTAHNGSGGSCPLGNATTVNSRAITYTTTAPASGQPVIFHG